MLSFHRVVEADFSAVNQLICEQLRSRVHLVEDIGQYIVEAGGKRLRPLVVLLVARSLGATGDKAVSLAAIIEFIHTATLLHDDVVDTSALRRGRDTANALWGNAPSVLVGDFLYSRAFQMMVALNDMRIMDILSQATNTIAEGEVLQLEHAGNPDISESRYREVIQFKTATLFEAAARVGGVAAETNSATMDTLATYGMHLGMAFQLMDDLLDYQGERDAMGKNIGDDLAEGKPTLPLIWTMANGNADDASLVRCSIEQRTARHLPEIVAIVQRNGALDYTREAAQAEVTAALAALDALPGNKDQYREALSALAAFAINRSM